jgi:hypothetical protein
VALFFLCFLLSGSGGGLNPSSSASPSRKRQISGALDPDGPWQFFSAQQRPVPPAKTLSWDEARAWVRQGLEALALADGEQGWRAVADPLTALRDAAAADTADSSRRRRQLLDSYRISGWPLRWGGPRAIRRRQLGEGAGQGIDPDSLDVPADDAGDEVDEEGAADGRPPARAPTALVVVPTANVWNMTAAMISTLEMCRDRFELLVRGRVQVLCSAAIRTLT